MVRVTHVDDDGVEGATVELDNFTVEILYSGIAIMLRDAATKRSQPSQPVPLSKQARTRREKVLNRIYG
jgi:hypothetical protein